MKVLFKIFAVIFLLNIVNIFIGLFVCIYKYTGCVTIDNYFFEDLFIFSMFMLFPLSGVLLYLLSKPI